MNMNIFNDLVEQIPMTRIIFVDAGGAAADDLTAMLTASPRLRMTKVNAEAAARDFDAESGDIAIIDLPRLEEAEYNLLQSVRSQAPELPIVVISPQLAADEMRRLFKIGIQDWLPTPVRSSDLFDTIQTSAKARRNAHNDAHAIVSVVGGAGATTIALTAADVLAERNAKSNPSVALFDLDFSLGNCGNYANLLNEFKLSSVANTPRRVDPEFIRAIQKKHEKGFFIYSFKQPDLNGDLNGYELVLRLLDTVTTEHSHTVLDIPYYMTEWRDEVLAAVNTVTLVTELNLAAIKHTIDAIKAIRTIRGEDFPIQVVFNKWESHLLGQRVGRKQVRELLGDVPVHHIPVDNSTIGEAIDRGLLPSQVRKSSRFIKAVRKYVKTLQMAEAK